MSSALALATPTPSVRDGLLPAVFDDDPDERLVTDTLLDRLDIAADLECLVEGLADLLEHVTSPRTRRAYESDFTHFVGWARDHGRTELPAAPQTIALYITSQQHDLRPTSLLRRLSAIAGRHRSAGYDSPPRTSSCPELLPDFGASTVSGRPPNSRWSPLNSP